MFLCSFGMLQLSYSLTLRPCVVNDSKLPSHGGIQDDMDV